MLSHSLAAKASQLGPTTFIASFETQSIERVHAPFALTPRITRGQAHCYLASRALIHSPTSTKFAGSPEHSVCKSSRLNGSHSCQKSGRSQSATKPGRICREKGQITSQIHPELEKLVNITVPGKNGSPKVAAFVARPAKAQPGKLPVVIMIHEFYGLTEDMIGKAQALAEELGALVIAPDTYRGDWTSFIPKAIFLALSTPQERVNEDLDSIVAWAGQQQDADVDRLTVMGFCYGGGKAIRYSATRGNAAATVVFYGSPLTDIDALSRLKGPVLLIYGDKDGQFPPTKVQAFRDALVRAGVSVQLSIYPGQGHAFFRNMAQVEANDGPQRQAWSELLVFLRGALF